MQSRRAQRPTFRSAVDLTTITATVVDLEGRLVTDLDQEAFEVYEDGHRQTITQFTNERVSISLAVLLDISDSMHGRRIQDARLAIDGFVTDLLDPDDELALLAFNHRQHLMTGWVSERSQTAAMLGSLRPSGSTAIYDAVAATLPLTRARNRPRAAALIVSDGADTASDVTLRELRSALVRSDTFVYAIAIDSSKREAINAAVNPAALREITDQSGGRTLVVHDSGELAAALREIAEELNHQYLIGYSPPKAADGRFHTIRVRLKDSNARVRARSGYVAIP